jgi:hypothetical protein
MKEKKIKKNFLFPMFLFSPVIPISIHINIDKLIEIIKKYNYQIKFILISLVIFLCLFIFCKIPKKIKRKIEDTIVKIIENIFLILIYNKIAFLLILLSPLIIIYFLEN